LLSFRTHDGLGPNDRKTRVDEAFSAATEPKFRDGLSALPSQKEKANAFVNAPLQKQAGAQKSTPPNGGLLIRAELFIKVFLLRRRKWRRNGGNLPNNAQNAGEDGISQITSRLQLISSYGVTFVAYSFIMMLKRLHKYERTGKYWTNRHDYGGGNCGFAYRGSTTSLSWTDIVHSVL
jgi:hypothetical protein